MADPSLEKGYTRIANKLLETIYSTNFTATEFKILMLIMIYTDGFSREEFQFSLTFISKGIDVSKRYVSSTMRKLIEDNIIKIVKEHTDTQGRIISLNKDYDTWRNRTTVQQVKRSSTVEQEIYTTDELQFHTTDEAEIHQDNKSFKESIKDISIDHFLDFWEAYPRKVGRAAALKSFSKLHVSEALLNDMLLAIEDQKATKQWQDKQFIPHAATWLNQRRWEDETEDNVRDSLSMTAAGTFKF